MSFTKDASLTINAITEFLFIGEDINTLSPCDLVLVLGNDFVDGTMEKVKLLFDKGIILKNAKIILSGATGVASAGKDLECNRMYDSAVNKFYMLSEMFIKEPKAKNAYENFKYCKQLVEDIGGFDTFNKILCIGKAFLLRRASMYAAHFKYPSAKMQYFGTVDTEGKNIGPETWWKSQDSVDRVMAEVERIGKYYREGYLSIY